MASITGLCESAGDVVGVRGTLEILEVAGNAGVGGQVVIVVDVAIGTGARRHGMHAGEREVDAGVIEDCRRPARSRMAGLAGRREIQRDVARIIRALEVLQVARHAGGAVQSIVAVSVAIRALAWRNCVHSRQREAGRGMVELSIGPLHRVMALFTGGGEARVRHRAGCAGEILLVTCEARHVAQVVIVVNVAIDAQAGRNGMSSGEKESGRAVVKLGIEPVVRGVAALASGRELCGNVVRVGSVLKVSLVAGVACRRQRLELAVGAPFVTGVAVNRRVGTRQREAIIVLLNVFDSDCPSADGVALLAIGAELALVNISVAVLAALADVGENHLHVTPGAGHGSVHAAQRIARLIMVELGNGADRLPATRGMTVLAGNGQVAVRTMRTLRGLRPRAFRESGESKDQNENKFRCNPSAHDLHLAFVLYPTLRI